LFRQEVLAARSDQFLGSIRIGRPAPFGLVTAVAVTLAAALIGFATWGQITRKARVSGFLVPTMATVPLASSVSGVLVERRVADGDGVAAGQVLFVLDTDRPGAGGHTAALVDQSLQQRRLTLEAERASRSQQARERQQALAARLRALDGELQRTADEAKLARQRVDLAARSRDRFAALAKEGFVSDIAAQQKQDEWLEMQARAQAGERAHSATQRDAEALRAELKATATQWATDAAQVERQLAALRQESTENEARRQVVVTAPQHGVVSAIHLPLGGLVQPGQTIATLIPSVAAAPAGAVAEVEPAANPLQAHLYAPSRMAGFVEPGQRVWMRYTAYPHQKFGMAEGTVIAVSTSPIASQDLPAGQQAALASAAQSTEPLFRIIVRLDRQAISVYGALHSLKPGMALDADVVQARLAVWEWILDPVLSGAGKLKVLSANPSSASFGG
jgi:membrane fusion protein